MSQTHSHTTSRSALSNITSLFVDPLRRSFRFYHLLNLIKKSFPQELQKPSSLKSLKIQNTHRYLVFSALQPSEMASLSNFRCQNRREHPIRSINNGDMVHTAKCDVVIGSVTSLYNYREAEHLKKNW